MFIARIDGSVVSTAKHGSLRGFKLLIGQRLDSEGNNAGEPHILLDPLGAGRGSLVFVTSESEMARKFTGDNTTPSRMVVIGIIDSMEPGR